MTDKNRKLTGMQKEFMVICIIFLLTIFGGLVGARSWEEFFEGLGGLGVLLLIWDGLCRLGAGAKS